MWKPPHSLRNRLKRCLRLAFEVGQRCGIDLLPRHFYSSVPDLRHLRASQYWRKPGSMVGIRGADVQSQFSFVQECCTPALQERMRRGDIHSLACAENGEMGYGPIEADFLACFIAAKRPGRVVQVGAGVSTSIILRAAAESGYSIDLTCIEPFPTDFLRRADAERRLRLIPTPAQEVELATLTDVGSGGLLFVDSTHTVKTGSEVNRIVLEVLPRLAGGTYVHFHDINFPYDYATNFLDTNFFWSEGTLLQAFLVHNARCRIAASLSMLHHAEPQKLKSLLPNFIPGQLEDGLSVDSQPGDYPSAIYLAMEE
jgi:predicted O-methyltransferase YrrM